jgi:hypothetical protein
MMPMLRRSAFCLALFALCCRREQKPIPRTEPWPAPALSHSAAGPEAVRATYSVTEGRVTVDVKVNERSVRGVIPVVLGTLDVNFASAEASRAKLRFDLSSFVVEGDAELTARARTVLGLEGGDVPEEARYAELAVTGLDPSARRGARRTMTAQADLTLNRVRVPVLLDLEVERRPGDAASPDRLVVRTRQPVTVSLPAHGLASGTRAAKPGAPDAARPALGPSARISAEINAQTVP